MAGHLLAAGHELFIRDLEPAPKEFIDCGATECGTCCEVADQAKVVTIMVPDTPDVAGLLFGIDGVSEGLTAGTTVVDMSTISPIETKVFAERINALGCDYLDAPVSGGKVGARNAALTIMVGQSESAFEGVKPLFELMADHLVASGISGDAGRSSIAISAGADGRSTSQSGADRRHRSPRLPLSADRGAPLSWRHRWAPFRRVRRSGVGNGFGGAS